MYIVHPLSLWIKVIAANYFMEGFKIDFKKEVVLRPKYRNNYSELFFHINIYFLSYYLYISNWLLLPSSKVLSELKVWKTLYWSMVIVVATYHFLASQPTFRMNNSFAFTDWVTDLILIIQLKNGFDFHQCLYFYWHRVDFRVSVSVTMLLSFN